MMYYEKKKEENITIFDLNIIYPCIQITGPKHFNWLVWFLLIISSFFLHHDVQRRWFSCRILLRLLRCVFSYTWTIHVSRVHSAESSLIKIAYQRRWYETSHGLGPCWSPPLRPSTQTNRPQFTASRFSVCITAILLLMHSGAYIGRTLHYVVLSYLYKCSVYLFSLNNNKQNNFHFFLCFRCHQPLWNTHKEISEILRLSETPITLLRPWTVLRPRPRSPIQTVGCLWRNPWIPWF